jgi:hypothetical protein
MAMRKATARPPSSADRAPSGAARFATVSAVNTRKTTA